jgi:predicted histone-like DNA-binding protein
MEWTIDCYINQDGGMKMAVQYSIIQKIKPGDPSAPRKFYATTKSSGEVKLRELADRISEISTVSSIDTLAVLESLIKVIPSQLLAGRIVRLGDFGTFRLSLSSEGTDTEEEFSKNNIKSVKLIFRPGKIISTELKMVEFQKE